MILQHLYWTGIKNSVYREVKYCDTCQHTKRSTNKCGELHAELGEKTQWNKLCVDIIGPYKYLGKVRAFNLKSRYYGRPRNQVV